MSKYDVLLDLDGWANFVSVAEELTTYIIDNATTKEEQSTVLYAQAKTIEAYVTAIVELQEKGLDSIAEDFSLILNTPTPNTQH